MRPREGEARLAEVIGKLVARPEEIEAVLKIFENTCQFKNLNPISSKLTAFFKLVLHEPEQNFEKLKLLLQRVMQVISSFQSFIGSDLKDCPEYDAIIGLSTQGSQAPVAEACPIPGLSRQRQLNWYIKAIDYYTLQLNALGH